MIPTEAYKITKPVIIRDIGLKKTIETETQVPEEINPLLQAEAKGPEPETKDLKIMIVSCSWSADTIIDKKSLLLNLTDDELKAIGILKKGTTTFYHNIVPGLYDWGIFSDEFPVEERIITYNKFYVAYVTNSQFDSDMDTLVPVVTNNKNGDIYWFTPDKSLFSLLPERYNYLGALYENLICLKKKYPQRVFTNFIGAGEEKILDPVTILDPDREALRKIGVITENECVMFQSRNKKYTLKICRKGTYSTGNDDDTNLFPPNPYPVIITDTLGRRMYTTNTIGNNDSLSKILNILVPVRIRVNEIVNSGHEVIICWYYPTTRFINALPVKTGAELTAELKIIKNDIKGMSSSCNYFEVCKSTIKLNNFKLYPNPAQNTVNIEFENTEEVMGSISIVNMAGLKLRELLPKTTFLTGHNHHQMDLSGISPGMYLISINTGKGFKTQRLIISR